MLGIWTLEKKGILDEKLLKEESIPFGEVLPSLTHMALLGLIESGKIKHIISQNIDGMHLQSGIKKENLSELVII
jgi:mono-ADP-ribosyltransferase sirtuin 6